MEGFLIKTLSNVLKLCIVLGNLTKLAWCTMPDHDLFDKKFDLDKFNDDDAHQSFRPRKKQTHRRRTILIFVGLNILSLLTLSFILTNGQIFNQIAYLIKGGSKQTTVNSKPQKVIIKYKPANQAKRAVNQQNNKSYANQNAELLKMDDERIDYYCSLMKPANSADICSITGINKNAAGLINHFLSGLVNGQDAFLPVEGAKFYFYISADHKRIYSVALRPVGDDVIMHKGEIYQDVDGTWKNY